MPINNLHIGRAAAGIHGTLLDGVTLTFGKGILENADTKLMIWICSAQSLLEAEREKRPFLVLLTKDSHRNIQSWTSPLNNIWNQAFDPAVRCNFYHFHIFSTH